MKPKEILALKEEELFKKLKENVDRKVLEKYDLGTEEVKRRIDFEFAEIKKNGFAKNILILENLVEYANNKNIPVGYLSGTAVPRIVNYILGITEIDPIQWGLFSEQIYHLDNNSIPSIHINFGNFRLIKKYMNKHYHKLIKLEETRISKEEKTRKVGINLNPNLNIYSLEEADIIDRAVKLISKKISKQFSLENISLDDKLTFALFQNKKTENIFGFEHSNMGNYLGKLYPETINHLCSLWALRRPDVINSGMLDKYISNRLNTKDIEKIHPVYDKYTEETYGVLVFKEQLLSIIHEITGISILEASEYIKAFPKKDYNKMVEFQSKFIELGIENGYLKKDLFIIREILARCAGFAFGKFHAISYCYISYQMAFIKAQYPIEFTTAIWYLENHKEIAKKRYERMKEKHSRCCFIIKKKDKKSSSISTGK